VDFSKAFDRVGHNVIVPELIDRGVPHCLCVCSYLTYRRQSVRVDGDWLSLAGGVPQGSLVGPLTFMLLVDDLRLQCLTHKYVDDTLTELFPRGLSKSQMQVHLQDLQDWTTDLFCRVQTAVHRLKRGRDGKLRTCFFLNSNVT